MQIVFKESRGVFWLRHLLQRFVRFFRKNPNRKFRICAFPDDQIGRDIAVTGLYEEAAIRSVEWMIRSEVIDSNRSGFFLDIGANIGIYTLVLAGRFHTVLAFEPHPMTRRLLQLNVEINGLSNVVVSPYALSNETGYAVLREEVGNIGASTIDGSDCDKEGCRVEVREASPLVEEFLAGASISFIKLDVEGHELKVLQGLRRVLAEQTPVIAFEANRPSQSEDILALLRELGYVKFIAIDLWPAIPSSMLNVLIHTIIGVRYVVKEVNVIEKDYSLVFALDLKASERWKAAC